MDGWVSLQMFSSKYNLSISTLRRRIKNNQIPHKLENGKYLVLDQKPIEIDSEKRESVQAIPSAQETLYSPLSEERALQTAHKLVDELKIAYAKILQEKEEQISQLKEEITDLRMLVKVLEDHSAKEKKPTVKEDFFFSDDMITKY